MKYDVIRKGEAAGTLSVEDDGLYRVLDARLEYSGEILRLYLWGRSFGVFAPEDGVLRLRRRVSRASLPELPGFACAWCEADGRWLPAGPRLLRFTPEGRELAIPWRTDAPMDFPAAPEKLRAAWIGGRCCLLCALPYGAQ